MKVSNHGIDLIKKFEGLRLQAYQCSAGVWTIGHGHALGSSNINSGRTITKENADFLLRRDIEKVEDALNRAIKVPLNQNQFDALASWCYNVGEGSLLKSSLLKKLNNGDYAGVPAELRRWDKARGDVIAGLVRRREEEARLFTSKESDNE